MAKRKSLDFLPSVFKTPSNQRFLNATVDQLIQEPALKKIYGYIGQQDQSPVFDKQDYYIAENDTYAQFYQLEPGVVIKKKDINSNTYKVNNVYNYVDILNQLVSDGGINNDHNRLFTNTSYNYNGFVDLDKLTNYRQYYWVPQGPLPVDVTANGIPLQKDYYIHRQSYTVNNQTELQSASIGRSGYLVDGFNNSVNPTITLQRGGQYSFHIGQPNHKFYIQTEIGTSGVSSVQENISTRDVLGVSNNGIEVGTITFNVPLKNAQDNLLALTSIQNIDMIVTVPYNLMQGVNYDSFIQEYDFDGVRAFDNKYIYINVQDNTTWDDVPVYQRTGIWQVHIETDRTMTLKYITDWPNSTKSFINQGYTYGHTFVYKNTLGYIQKFPTLSAPLDKLYYVDADNPLIYGEIQLVDPEPSSLLNVNDIIGRTQYTSPNGVKFTSGLKIKFTGLVYPTEYQQNEYIVEGVGSSIKLLKWNDLVTPEKINTNLTDYFGSDTVGYDIQNYDATLNSPQEKDYVTINRSSVDGNSWSRNNRWFHREVLQYAANFTNQVWEFDSNQQAKRPIVEFLPNIKLFNYGTNYGGSVTIIDSYTSDAFNTIEGQNSYAIKHYDSTLEKNVYDTDNIRLQSGHSVIFVNDADPNVRKTIYKVQANKLRATASYTRSITDYSNYNTNKIYINQLNDLAIGQTVLPGSSWTRGLIPDNTTITAIDYDNNFITISNNLLGSLSPFRLNPAFTTLGNTGSGSNVITIASTVTGTLSLGSNLVPVDDYTKLLIGQTITGSGIPANTYITYINTNTSVITLNNNVTANGSSTITAYYGTSNISVGELITGIGIPAQTYVTAVAGTTITISNNATITNTNVTLQFDDPSDNTDITYLTFNNNADQIHLIPYKQVSNGDNIIALEGDKNQGIVYYYEDGNWTRAQVRNSRPQFPLFDVIDSNGFSFSNKTIYPSNNFTGSYLFGYAIGSGTRDAELGFPLTYKSIGNIGDIVFQNYYITDYFDYNQNQTDTVVYVKTGFAPIIVGYNNYNFANGWQKVIDKTKQYITKTFTANDAKFNNYDLGVKYKNSYYENNLFVYVNNVLQSKTNYILSTNNNTSVISFVNDLNVGDRLFVKIFGTSPEYKNTYTMPRNLTNNSANTEFSTITLGQVRNHLIEIGENSLDLVGEAAGNNNFRDISYNYIGGKLLQHSASMRVASLMFSNPDVDPIRAINFNMQSYQVFKNQLFDFINNREFSNPNDYRTCLDAILLEFSKLSSVNNNFYYTDMIAGGSNYITNHYTIQDTTYRNFNLVNNYAIKEKSYNAVLVYLNGTLLINGIDYSINNFTVTLLTSLTITRGDILEIVEYASTLGCNIPATPSKLGLYPKFVPEIMIDDTYTTPRRVIVGHDGSYTLAYNDYRDYIILEFEKRVYNNIAVNYENNNEYDLSSVQPGAFRATDYTIDEWTQLLSASYLSWSSQNNVDIFSNDSVTNDPFTFNYSSATDKVFGETLPGYWRGIYNYFYDTDRPHTHPWEMLGFSQKPEWWNRRYGPSPYSRENTTLWSDLELGFIYNGNPNTSYINYRYSRPGLSQIIPVDEHGNLLSPMQSIVSKYEISYASDKWRIGDQSPQETAWRRSSSYPFAVQIAWCLARPAEYCALKYNTRDVVYNSKLDQIINKKTNNRVFDFSITTENEYIPGINVWVRDLLISNNLDVFNNWIDIANNSTFNLVYKMSGFTDKSYLTVVADQISPQTNNVSVLIPQENYQIKVTKSAPVARAVYSAVVVQKTASGYQVTGFDKARPYFLTIPSRVNGNSYSITVGNETGIIYRDSEETILSYPYGTIFATKQQVVDFLISYGRYLTNLGFVFNNMLPDNQTVSDWTLSVKEFLFWEQQNWGENTVIGLTPAGTNITYNNFFGIVDKITNDHNFTKVIDSDGVTLTGRDYRVYREDNTFSIELKNNQKGIHLLDIAVIQYEHCLIFDNQTVFNDILYDEEVGSRQYRLKLDGVKTQDWNGSLYAPGFLINYSDIQNWVSFTDYYKGDIILYKKKYYTAQSFIPGKATFVSSDWYEINGDMLSKSLIPNMTSGAAQFAGFYDPDVADLNTAADIQSKHAVGFQDRQYFTDLGLDRTSQYKFYLGMIAQKGTKAVINAFLRNKSNRFASTLDNDIKLVEQWAIKLGNYGGTYHRDKLEFNIGNSKTINNQYLFKFINNTDTANTDYNSIKLKDLLYQPKNYNTNLFESTDINKPKIPTAGPVTVDEVAATVFDISRIYNISSLSAALGESSKIWIAADADNQWGVYRLTQTDNIIVTNVSQTGPTQLTFTTNKAHGLATLDYVMLKNAKISAANTSGGILDLSGFYRVSDVSDTTFNVKISKNSTVASGTLNSVLFKLINIRFQDGNDFASFTPARGWQDSETVYIDDGKNDWEVKKNTESWKLNETLSPIFTSPSDLFGTSIKINYNQNFAIVGSPGKNTYGSATIYGKSQDNHWQELAILGPDNRDLGFGSSVDYNKNNIAFITAPNANKGSVYTAIANSQSISISQIIHYDNLYVTTAGITTSNSYVLVPSATSLANFANGMTILGSGIATNTQIANISLGSPYNKIGLTKTTTSVPANSTLTIYPNLTPSSSFGASVSASADGNWLYVGEPTLQKVFVYRYNNVTPSTTLKTGDGSSKDFVYPSTAIGLNLGPRDFTVYVNDVLKVPDLDYIKSDIPDSIQFISAPANGSIIRIEYRSYFQEVAQFTTNDANASGFGSSISCSADGRHVVVGASTSTAVFDKPYSNAGTAYVYERTVENFIANGSVSTFTTTSNLNYPKVYVDGVLTTASYDYGNNKVFTSSVPAIDSIVSVETNQFVLTKTLNTDIGQVGSNFGEKVKICPTDCSIYVGAPGWNTTSNSNGSVWRFVNVPKLYGIAVGTATNPFMIAGYKLRINDYLVTFTGGDIASCVNDINNAKIPGITASIDVSGGIKIVSDISIAYNKLTLRNDSGTPLNILGVEPWKYTQKIISPIIQDTQRFGEKISISPDAKTLVIGATLSNSRLTTTFDGATTSFDINTIKFVDVAYLSGAAHVYEYQPSRTETYNDIGSFAYATLLKQNTAFNLDRFATGIDISDNFILVGAPHAHLFGNPVGSMNVYYNSDSSPVWKTIRKKTANYNNNLIERVYLYSSYTSKLIADLPIIDLKSGLLPLASESYIDYITNYDPAVYSNVPTTVSFNYDKKSNWGQEKIGTLWWDINSIKYYDNSQGTLLEKFLNWGMAFPSSVVQVYEWIESDLLPADYAQQNPRSLPLYTVNDVYSSRIVVDESTGQPVTKYYFWIRNSTQQIKTDRPTALEIQTSIANPKSNSEPFAAIIDVDAIGIFNVQNFVGVDTNLVIDYKTVSNPQLTHTEWTMYDDGTDYGVAVEFINKLGDSLSGQDASGRSLPDINLPKSQKYGMEIRPRQTLFSDEYTARKLYIEEINKIFNEYPMKLVRSSAIEYLYDKEPEPIADTYVTRVNNLDELSYLDKNTYRENDIVLVASDSSANNNWSLYKLKIVLPNNRSWEIFRVQKYNVANYWNFADWYSSYFDPQIIPTYIVDKESDIGKLSLNLDDVIYVKNSNDGGWKYVLVKDANLELMAQQNATIQLKDSLYNLAVAGQGYQTSSLETVGFSADNNLEFKIIFDVIKDRFLTNEFRTNFKDVISLMIDTIANQHLQTDWLMKTSFVDIYHRVRGLDPLPVYLPQPQTTVTDFFNEVKPYHTKLKQYVAKYDNKNNEDVAYTSLTDFDLQPYYNTTINQYRSPQENNVLDTTALTTQKVYAPWKNNHLLYVKRIDVLDGGNGYSGDTSIEITGDGVGATAVAYIVNGMIKHIDVISGGSNYTHATVNIYGIGQGAKAFAILGNDYVRTFDSTIKFDRYSYFNNIQDWQKNTSYTTNTVVIYENQPYRVIQNHISSNNFDLIYYLPLVIKVWKPYTQFALNDIVIYENASYLATNSFVSDFEFDTRGNSFTLKYWTPNTSYTTQDIIAAQNKYYKPKQNFTSSPTIEGDFYESFTFNGKLTYNSNIILITDTSGIAVGQNVSGLGIPSNTTVTGVVENTSITISQVAVQSGNITLTFFTGNLETTTINMVPYNGLWLDNACDRIWAYYSPTSGMAGRDLAQLMIGIQYPGVKVTGPDFDQTTYYSVLNYDSIPYDYSSTDESGIADIYGLETEDTKIRSSFLDTALGLRPEDINIIGGDFVDSYSSHAPEELVPGKIGDTLDIRVKTLPSNGGSNDIKIFSKIYTTGLTSISFKETDTGVSYPIGGIEKFNIIDYIKGPIVEGIDYTVNWKTKNINLLYTPAAGTFFQVIMFGSTGQNPVFDSEYFGDGIQRDFLIPDNVLTNVQQAYVKVNGFSVDNWQLVNKLENGYTTLCVRFDTAPDANSVIQIHLYAVALGTKAYMEMYEETFSVGSTPSYPISYYHTLTKPEIYKQPISAYTIVRLNNVDLMPPQQSYFIGDAVQTTFKLTDSYTETISLISDNEILVVVDGVVQIPNIDYTITHDGVTMPNIVFVNPPKLGSQIVVSDSNFSDFKIYDGNQLVISPNVVIPSNAKISVMTQGNHDTNQMYTKLFSGSTSTTSFIDLGFDTKGFENLAFDNEISNVVTDILYTLPRSVYNINQIYVSLKSPGTSGGFVLLPYIDYVLVTPNLLRLRNSLNISGSSTILVRIFGDNIRQNIIEYRIFKDIRDTTRYYSVKSFKNTRLTQNLNLTDEWIYCENVDNLQSPDPQSNSIGILFLNGERITYRIIDKINKRVGKIRRGTAGTGIATLHQQGTIVIDGGSSLEIPNSADTTVITPVDTYLVNGFGNNILVKAGEKITQGVLFTELGVSLQESNTPYATFIRDQQ